MTTDLPDPGRFGAALDELLEERSALTGPPMPQMLRAFEAAGLPIPDDVE